MVGWGRLDDHSSVGRPRLYESVMMLGSTDTDTDDARQAICRAAFRRW